jgi:hypothetical protein
MAENKEVVEMSEKFLASLFGLAKKWLIDWKIDFQKLFHALQQVSKEGLIGLAEGTYEIKPKATTQKVVTSDEDFECIYTSELITIPDMGAITADCKKLWSDKMGSAPIPEGLKTGIQKRVKIIRLKKNKSSQKIVDHLKQYPGAILPNVFGLRIAELNCLAQLPKDVWIRGIDERDNLSVVALGDRMVPDACFDSDGGVRRAWNSWDGDWLAGNCFLLLCD